MSKTKFVTASFRKALALVSQATPKTSPLPIITMVRVRLACMSGSDTKTQITAPVEGTGDPIDICMPPDKLRAAVEAAGEFITLSMKGSACEVVSGKHKFKIQTLPGADYPVMAIGKAVAEFDGSAEMNDTLSRVSNFAADPTDVRYYLHGVRMENDAQGFTVIATNGHGMAYRSIERPTAKPFSCLLPTAACSLLAKSQPGRWIVTDGQAVIANDDGEMIFTLINGIFPEWQRVKVKGNATASFKRRELDEVIGLSVKMSQDRKAPAMMLSQDGTALLCESARSADGQGLDTSIELTDVEGIPLKVGVNMMLLGRSLKCITSDMVRLVWMGNASDDSLQSGLGLESDDGMRTVVMPMRI